MFAGFLSTYVFHWRCLNNNTDCLANMFTLVTELYLICTCHENSANSSGNRSQWIRLPSNVDQVVTSDTCCREVSGSNVGQDTDYPDWSFSFLGVSRFLEPNARMYIKLGDICPIHSSQLFSHLMPCSLCYWDYP
jgi:hypothetical protein